MNLPGNDACGGKKQSPIDIQTSEVVNDKNLTEFMFTEYDVKPTAMTMKNNGHTGRHNLYQL